MNEALAIAIVQTIARLIDHWHDAQSGKRDPKEILGEIDTFHARLRALDAKYDEKLKEKFGGDGGTQGEGEDTAKLRKDG